MCFCLFMCLSVLLYLSGHKALIKASAFDTSPWLSSDPSVYRFPTFFFWLNNCTSEIKRSSTNNEGLLLLKRKLGVGSQGEPRWQSLWAVSSQPTANRLRVSTLICPQEECGWNAEHLYLLREKSHFPFQSSKADHRHHLTLYLYKTRQGTWDVVLFKCGFLYQVQVVAR